MNNRSYKKYLLEMLKNRLPVEIIIRINEYARVTMIDRNKFKEYENIYFIHINTDDNDYKKIICILAHELGHIFYKKGGMMRLSGRMCNKEKTADINAMNILRELKIPITEKDYRIIINKIRTRKNDGVISYIR